jgi:hypothetical protein
MSSVVNNFLGGHEEEFSLAPHGLAAISYRNGHFRALNSLI